MQVTQHPETRHLLLRQYAVRLKKGGGRVPRTELTEMGPALDLALRRLRAPPPELLKEALRQPKVEKKKARRRASRGGGARNARQRGSPPARAGLGRPPAANARTLHAFIRRRTWAAMCWTARWAASTCPSR